VLQNKRLVKAWIIIISLIVFAGSVMRPYYVLADMQDDLKQQIDAICQPLIESNEYVGIVVGCISGGDVATYGYGKTMRRSGTVPNENTIFEIGSVTKTFTTLILADMVLKGQVNLTDPIEKFLPSTVHVPSYNGVKITLEHLATHTSGLPKFPTNLHPPWFNAWDKYSEADLYAFINSYNLTVEPGTVFEYSDLGMGLLGHVLELITGTDYETLVVQQISNILNMSDTRITLSNEQEARLAKPYYKMPNLPEIPPIRVNYLTMDVLKGCGALLSTVADLITYVQANLGLKQSSLSPAMEFQHTPLYKAAPDLRICLGWFVWEYREGARVFWHIGDTYGMESYVFFIEGEQVGVVVLANTRFSYEVVYSGKPPLSDAAYSILRIVRQYHSSYPNQKLVWSLR
jgi:D-alanyl-D-alanine-carboxypeptidase/D-alanyl-D-alanine-endopeptidase